MILTSRPACLPAMLIAFGLAVLSTSTACAQGFPDPPDPPDPPTTALNCAQHQVAYTNGVWYYESANYMGTQCVAPFGTGYSNTYITPGCFSGCTPVIPLINLTSAASLSQSDRLPSARILRVSDRDTAIEQLTIVQTRLADLKTNGAFSTDPTIKTVMGNMISREQLLEQTITLIDEWLTYLKDNDDSYDAFRTHFQLQYIRYLVHFVFLQTGGGDKDTPDAGGVDLISQPKFYNYEDIERTGTPAPNFVARVSIRGEMKYFYVAVSQGPRGTTKRARVTIGQQTERPLNTPFDFELVDGAGYTQVIRSRESAGSPSAVGNQKIVVSTFEEQDLWLHLILVEEE